MIGTNATDPGMEIDWGKTSEDYAKYRPGPPITLYEKLKALDVGQPDQRVLDIGTGTGVLARQMARQGCKVTATDISEKQVLMAQALSTKENLEIDFKVCSSEEISFDENSFDIITANQCFLYFDLEKVIPIFNKILAPNGSLVISHFSWMPLLDSVAKASEELILKHNPNWSAHSYKGDIKPSYPSLEKDFKYKSFFYYDEGIPFTKESWRGRIRACRGVGAALSSEVVAKFDREHAGLLDSITTDEFNVIHRIDAHILTRINS